MTSRTLHLDKIFHALSDPTRREILMRIAVNNALTVSDIAQPYHISLPAVSKHIRVLESAHLIRRRKSGKEHTFVFSPEPMKTVEGYIRFYSEDRFVGDK